VFDGLAVHNSLKRHSAAVTIYVDGIAASIASVIAMAGDRVVMPENTMMMIHDPAGVIAGTADELREYADVIDKIKSSLVSAYRAKTGLETDVIESMMTAETWLSATDAVDQGFADELEQPLEIAASFDLSRFRNAPAGLLEGSDPEPDAAAQVSDETEVHSMADKTLTGTVNSAPEPSTPATGETTAQSDQVVALTDEEKATIANDAAKAERDRLLGIENAAKGLDGVDDLVADLKADPDCTVEQASARLLERVKVKGSDTIANLRGEDPDVSAAPTETTAKSETDPKAVAAAIRDKIAEAEKDGRIMSSAQAAAELGFSG